MSWTTAVLKPTPAFSFCSRSHMRSCRRAVNQDPNTAPMRPKPAPMATDRMFTTPAPPDTQLAAGYRSHQAPRRPPRHTDWGCFTPHEIRHSPGSPTGRRQGSRGEHRRTACMARTTGAWGLVVGCHCHQVLLLMGETEPTVRTFAQAKAYLLKTASVVIQR